MRVAIIGAGIVGVATAHELAQAGAEVTVFERRASVAAEASFGLGGLVAPAALAAFDGLARGRLGTAAGGLTALPWRWRRARAGRRAPREASAEALYRLASFSRERQLELTRSLDLEYEQNPGCLVLLRSEREWKAVQPALARLQRWGVAHEQVDAARARQLEPGLSESAPLHTALHLPHDGVGNGRQFAHLLKAQAQRLGARFCFDTPVRRLHAGAEPAVETDAGERQAFDHLVLCAGNEAQALLAPLKLALPLRAVSGCSVTAPLRPIEGLPLPGPKTALVDARHGITLARLGQRVRAAGGFALQSPEGAAPLGLLRQLYGALEEWFPGAASVHEAQHWHGARPMLPDGAPVLGASGLPGLWLNLGHGSAGWTLACGSARVLADCVLGRQPAVDASGLTLQRLR